MKVQDPFAKLPYLNCYNKKHQGQTLNLVCIQRNCKNSGLICSLCRDQHQSHRIIPLKLVISQLKKQTNNPIESDVYCEKLQILQNLKQSMLYQLKCCVEQIAEQFRELQEDIYETYTKIKVQIIQQIQLSMQLNDLAASTVYGINDQQAYISNFQKLSKWINEKEKQLRFSLNLQQFITPYQFKNDHLASRLTNMTKYIKNGIIQFKNNKFQPKIQLPIVIVPKEKLTYRFSQSLKGASIVLNPQKTLAKQGSTTSSRFALIEQGMGLKQRKITFKVNNLANWIGVGVCLKDRITSVNYAFKYEVLGHGSYLLSNNGYTWSHSASEDNIHSCSYVFKKGSIIDVTLTPSEIIFKERQNANSYKLKISYKEQEWPNVCFCANLCSENDSIQILDE